MSNPLRRARRYAVVVLITIAGLIVREILGATIVPSVFLTFYASVLASALVAGFEGGLLSTALAAVLGWALFLPPIFSDAGFDATTAIRLVLFCVISVAMSAIVARRSAAQARVAEREARLRRLVESDIIGVFFWERAGPIREANDRFLQLMGYSREDLEAGRVRWPDITPPEYAPLDAAGLEEIDRSGSCAPIAKEFLRKDGERVPVLIAGAATTDALDKGVSVVLDMTEHNRTQDELRQAKRDLELRVAERTAELQAANARLQEELAERHRVAEALRESEERYRQASEATSDFAYRFRIDANGRLEFEWHAGAFSRITGYGLDELRSLRGIMALVHPDDRGVLVDRMVRLLRGESTVTEFRLMAKSGEYRWLRDHGRPEWDAEQGRVVYVVGGAIDITDRKRVQEALRVSEERFALAVAGANDGIWDWQMAKGEVYLSPRWKEILGHVDEDLGSDPDEWKARIHPDDRAHVEADVTAHLEGLTPHFRSEYRMRHRDGGYRWVLSRGVAVRNAEGRATRMAGSMTDITARKQAEEEARRRQAELAHAQRLSTLGEMAAGLAHELNQPLAAIVSYASGCERRIRNGDVRSAEQLYAINQVAKQALRAGEVLQRYRTFVRTGATRREWVDLNALTEEVAQLAKPAADEEAAVIRLDLALDLPMVVIDSVQIEQVLVNLIRNGLEAMQSSEAGPRELWVRTRLLDDAVEVEVEDRGAGIADEAREHIFDAFFTTKGTGLGMGLSISRSIIDAHGGRLWPASNPEGGTTFHFTVPLVAVESESAEEIERLRRRG